jgi:hypothetical protein
MKLIDDWKQSWKFLSIRVNIFLATVATIFMALPRDDQAALLSLLPFEADGGALLVLILVLVQTFARLKAQPDLHE